jgi:hypothetical protein
VSGHFSLALKNGLNPNNRYNINARMETSSGESTPTTHRRTPSGKGKNNAISIGLIAK